MKKVDLDIEVGKLVKATLTYRGKPFTCTVRIFGRDYIATLSAEPIRVNKSAQIPATHGRSYTKA